MGEIIKELEEIVGPSYISDDMYVRWSYSMDSNIFDIIDPTPPAIVVRPKTMDEISKILRLANRTKTPIYVRGGGTGAGGDRGEKIRSSILIDITRMNDVIEIDEGSLTVTAQAGTTWGKLNAEVEKRGWRLGFKGPYSGYSSTVGGSVASQSNGYGSTMYGVVAEDVTNLTVVLPNGEVLKTGSAVNPNAKRFYRYCIGPDLAGIFIGSGGCFGVITEVTLRIYSKATDSAFGAYAFKDYNSSHRCYYRWLKSRVAEDVAWYARDGLEVMVPELAAKGFEAMNTFVVEDVTSELVQARKKLLDKIAVEEKGEPQDPMYAKDGWDYRFELLPRWPAKIGQWQWNCHMNSAGDTLKDLKDILAFLDKYEEECKKLKIYHSTISIAHKNAGHVSTSIYYDQSSPETVKLVRKLMDGMAETSIKNGGVNYWLGKMWYPYTIMKNPVYRETLIKLKKSLDPNNIMNPGGLALPADLKEE